MKVIVPTNSIPNTILVQDIAPKNGLVLVTRNQLPYGFVTYANQLFYLQTSAVSNTNTITGYTLTDLLNNIKKEISGNFALEYFETTNEQIYNTSM